MVLLKAFLLRACRLYLDVSRSIACKCAFVLLQLPRQFLCLQSRLTKQLIRSTRCYNVGVYCDQRKCKCEDCRNYPGYNEEDHEEKLEDLDSMPLQYVDVPTNAHTLSAVEAHSSQSLSASSGSSSTDYVVADKRVRHSQRTSRRRNKPQDLSKYYLGSPSPMRPSGAYEQV